MKTKKILYLTFTFIITFIWGCEQKFDNAVDSFNTNYQAISTSPTDSIFYNSADSLITINIKFNSVTTIQNVFCNVYASDNSLVSSLSLYDDGKLSVGDLVKGDKIFSNKVPFSRSYLNGAYNIKYFVTDNSNTTKLVAIGTFDYNNGQDNIPPVISNLVLVDSTQRNVKITFSVDVLDSNGSGDIKEVYYELYKPDGYKIYNSQGISQFPLFDDGNISYNGDVTAKDSKYTTQLTFPTDIATGLWRFEFRAKDRAGELSNKIIKSVKVL